MLSKLHLENILFLDIETVPETPKFSDLDTTKQLLWETKSKYQRKDEFTAEAFYDRAGIWAEFGKIVCISVGYFKITNDVRTFRVTSFYGDEITILKDFKALLTTHFHQAKHLLCAHNGKEFDFPYIARRMIIHGIQLPHKLNLFGKKPWEVPHLDTLELWKFGDYKNYTSLKLLTHVLGIPSPKDDIDGSEVYRVFYEEQDIDRIIKYCEKDTVAVAQILLRLRGDTLLHDNEITHI
ncbi:3'-5' exonuclease [Mangrovimonas yunxiaonensis]|uniref:3'-5' exonuclease n=1 Tax=Mangrovimonas yunxiaonensis TaxID=1197477 RepID=A0A084TKE5_9FLAO|nr:3'-5' exonuclease [Mangrovimonas yunxiaonensis]KFB01181.1 3'-5' exonuclease [Mangrovimonas yunxiaonensis]MBR9757952.1 3'-5' exonuclease [Algicola sp.]GGH38198.1 3'-5' exonuclease [Mangrovimonas yunxiaonensis]